MGIFKKSIALNLSLFKVVFLKNILFCKYRMVDSININKSLNINIGIVMKKPEMLRLVPDHLKTEKMCRHAVKKLP